MLPLLVDAALPRIHITFPYPMKGIYIHLPIPATHGVLSCQNLWGSQNVDVIGAVASPTEAHRAIALMEMCIGEQFWDC
jgi:hypothetical protein